MYERRKFIRLKSESKILVRETTNEAIQNVSLLDVSTGGMKVLLDKNLDIGTRLYSEFKILPQLGNFSVEGEVVWIKNHPPTSTFEAGIKFLKVRTSSIQDY